MRIIKFKVNSQKIEKDPECDFTSIVSGTEKYLKAHFAFSDEWNGCKKIARFWKGSEEHAIVLDNDECYIPSEVLTGRTFRIGVIGIKDDYRITTNRILVRQEVG